MPRSHPPYPQEFRAEAVRLYHTSGRSLQEVARDLGVTANSLREWVRRAEVEAGSREGLTQDERAELSRLRRENRVLKKSGVDSTGRCNTSMEVEIWDVRWVGGSSDWKASDAFAGTAGAEAGV